ncbi:NucA/NucB deoxyribonuclease domain-containing protein [Microtetraspora malaysiensis]|uniref:NucA/NucB deoxyribonuclease domain-containing protein n=1 Tax=Microtetraspora malaysiensis TaxID=161358 RepID=UPI003D8C7B1D
MHWRDPFGSTIEGAANPIYDYSLRALSGAQNSTQGNALKAFYHTYRIGDGSHFWVQIAP